MSNHFSLDIVWTISIVQFRFHPAFSAEASQKEVYDGCVKSLIEHTLCGKNASVFAYGPTGTGTVPYISSCWDRIISSIIDFIYKIWNY